MFRRVMTLVLLVVVAAGVVGTTGCSRRKTVFGYEEGWTKEKRAEAKKFLTIDVMPEGTPLDITSDHISNVSESVALAKCLQALNNYSVKDAEAANIRFPLSTVYEPYKLTRQIVDWHLQTIAVLNINPDERIAYEQVQGVSPGLEMVDTEDESKSAKVLLRNNRGDPYRFVLHYCDSWFNDAFIERYLWNQPGLSRNLFSPVGGGYEHYVDDITPEVEDGTGDLYYTATYNHSTFKVAHAWVMPKVEKTILVNAQTKKITEYTDPAQVPTWVDRIYSEQVMVQYINAWGYNVDNFNDTSNLGKLVLDENKLDVVLDSSNSKAEYVGVMTSPGRDNTGLGVMIVPTRSTHGKYYPLSGSRSIATRFHAEQVINNVVNHMDWHVEDLTLHWIYGRPTWVGTYVKKVAFEDQQHGTNVPGAKTIEGGSIMGTVLLAATCDLNPCDVIWAKKKADAFAEYERFVFRRQTSNVGSTALEENEGTGHVNLVRSGVVNGKTIVDFTLTESKYNNLWFSAMVESETDNDSIMARHISKGDYITFTYGDTKNSPTCFVRGLRYMK